MRLEMTYQVPVTPGDRARAGLVQQLIALSFGIPADDIRARGRLELKACRARWVALYLAHIGYGWPLERVGHVFGVTRATAGLGCRWAEDARDDPDFDSLLDRLTDLVRDICETPKLELKP